MKHSNKHTTAPEVVKYRLTGLIALFALAAIFIPMLLHEQQPAPAVEYLMPEMPITAEFVELEPAYTPADTTSGQGNTVASVHSQNTNNDDAIKHKIADKTAEDNFPENTAATPENQQTIRDHKPVHKAIWTLKLATLSVPTNAIKLIDSLQSKGFHAYSKNYQDDQNKNWQIVYVGPEADKSKLEKLQQEISDQYNIKGQIVPFRVE